MRLDYLWVALGGAMGSVSRYWLSGLVAARIGESFPWGTLIINITGSFLIGVIGAIASSEGRLDPQSRAFAVQFLMYGICGGYTTFSSFSYATLRFLQERQFMYAAGNVIGSVTLCMIAVWLGYLLGAMFTTTKGN